MAKVRWPITKRFMLTGEEGAATTLTCATAPELADHSGRFYVDGKERRPKGLASDDALARKLRERSQAWRGELLADPFGGCSPH
ncbi:MAG: hypothetical protein AAGA56_07720 [Myxococcota bacterium]